MEVDLSYVSTVQGVMAAINREADDIGVSIEANSSGTGFILTDSSSGSGEFKIEDMDGDTASDLGIAFSAYTNTIHGSAIAESQTHVPFKFGVSLLQIQAHYPLIQRFSKTH